MNMPLVLLNRRRRGFTAFSPSTLFALAEPGVWYDPSDLTTLYQDSAGTTPVTTPGQTVGLMLDKSKGGIGPELTNPANWTASGGTISVAGGTVVLTSSAAGAVSMTQTFTTTPGNYYKMFQSHTAAISTTVNVYRFPIYNNFLANIPNNQSTILQLNDTDNTTAVTVYFTATAAGQTVTLSSLSIKEVPGNHATQATLASRPIYGIEPVGGRRNLLLATDTLATQSLTVTAVAHTLAFTGTGTVTLSGASIAGPLIGTGASNRVSLTFTPTAASLTLTVVGSVTLGQLELGSSVTPYQRVTTQYDVTEAGVASTSYLAFDGVDDGMVTGTITPGVDKAQVFAGARVFAPSSSYAAIAETSPIFDGNGGTFTMGNTSSTVVWGSKGGVIAVTTPAQTLPAKLVLTGLGDIPADIATLRANGAQVGQSVQDQGTGNYLPWPMYIGRRGGTSIAFKGNLHSLITRFGANLDAGVITNTETWVAGKTGIAI